MKRDKYKIYIKRDINLPIDLWKNFPKNKKRYRYKIRIYKKKYMERYIYNKTYIINFRCCSFFFKI